MKPIPERVDEIDAAWLEAALAERHPGTVVRAVEPLERHEATNSHARLRIRYGAATDLPEVVFCKLLPSDPTRRAAIAATGMGPREARFYRSLAPRLSMRVPEVYVAQHAEDDGPFLLVMEDLVTRGCRVSDGTVGVSPDAAARALEDLAALHLRFADRDRRDAEASWVPAPQHSDYGQVLLQRALDTHRDRLSPRFAALAELYVDRGDALHALWQQGPQTVIHGDAHIGNLFDDAGRTGFLDWGIIQRSTPLRDVSYFLTMALDVEVRREREEELLRHYLALHAGAGLAPISFDEAWRQHRIHAAYAVPACCQIVVFPDGISERRRIFSEAFLRRAEAAIEDLDPLPVLRECGIA